VCIGIHSPMHVNQRTEGDALPPLPPHIVGKVNTAPDLMPSGQRVVTVFRRV
jgi:hypothetical protein